MAFDLNADADTVTGMDAFVVNAENAYIDATHAYPDGHTWSFRTEFTAVPQREGYTFKGWTTEATGVTTNGEGYVRIDASVCEDVVLTAQWEPISYDVTTAANPAEGGTVTGAGTYAYGTSVTVEAVAADGYTFQGWYEGEQLVSSDPEYTFTVTSARDLTAQFNKIVYNIKVDVTEGGSATGGGTYGEGETATLTASADPDRIFVGWFEDGSMISDEDTLSFTVTSDRSLVAKFDYAHTITTIADPATGGTLKGGGLYKAGATVVITAEPSNGYYFVGWYREDGECITTEKEHKLTADADYTFTAKFQQKVSYKCDYVYLFGYENTQIGATGPLLRGELAQMIYRLVRQNGASKATGTSFADTEGLWFQSGMTYMGMVGALDTSKTNGNPYTAVNRGETYKMICLGLGFTNDSTLSFSEYAVILRNSGYLSGDGAVTAKIKRYEFCELFNNILGRSQYCLNGYYDTDGNEVTAETYGYKDLNPGDAYYRTMMLATSTFTNGRIDIRNRIQRNTYDYTN